MSANGGHPAARPEIAAVSPAAGGAEAAAIAAALEQFMADTAPAPAAGPAVSPWLRAALQEGVGAKRFVTDNLSQTPRGS